MEKLQSCTGWGGGGPGRVGVFAGISWYNSHLKTLKIKGGAFRNSLETADGNPGCAGCQAARGLTLPVSPTRRAGFSQIEMLLS